MPEVSVCLAAAAIFEKVTSLSFELCLVLALYYSEKEDLSRLKVTFEFGTYLSLTHSLTIKNTFQQLLPQWFNKCQSFIYAL